MRILPLGSLEQTYKIITSHECPETAPDQLPPLGKWKCFPYNAINCQNFASQLTLEDMSADDALWGSRCSVHGRDCTPAQHETESVAFVNTEWWRTHVEYGEFGYIPEIHLAAYCIDDVKIQQVIVIVYAKYLACGTQDGVEFDTNGCPTVASVAIKLFRQLYLDQVITSPDPLLRIPVLNENNEEITVGEAIDASYHGGIVDFTVHSSFDPAIQKKFEDMGVIPKKGSHDINSSYPFAYLLALPAAYLGVVNHRGSSIVAPSQASADVAPPSTDYSLPLGPQIPSPPSETIVPSATSLEHSALSDHYALLEEAHIQALNNTHRRSLHHTENSRSHEVFPAVSVDVPTYTEVQSIDSPVPHMPPTTSNIQYANSPPPASSPEPNLVSEPLGTLVTSDIELIPYHLYQATIQYPPGECGIVSKMGGYVLALNRIDAVFTDPHTKKRGYTFVWGCELKLAFTCGATIWIEVELTFRGEFLFRRYSKDLYERRKQYKREGKIAQATMEKLRLNSLYGKMAQKPKPSFKVARNAFDLVLRDGEVIVGYGTVPGPFQGHDNFVVKVMTHDPHIGKLCQIASCITAYARTNLNSFTYDVQRLPNRIGEPCRVYYRDTDSVKHDLWERSYNPELVDAFVQKYIDDDELGKWKLEEEFDLIIALRKKTYIEFTAKEETPIFSTHSLHEIGLIDPAEVTMKGKGIPARELTPADYFKLVTEGGRVQKNMGLQFLRDIRSGISKSTSNTRSLTVGNVTRQAPDESGFMAPHETCKSFTQHLTNVTRIAAISFEHPEILTLPDES